MDSEVNSCSGSPWQANLMSLGRNLADQWQKSSTTSCAQEPKKLTKEAIVALSVILFFVSLSIIGSSINAFDSFRKAFLKKKTSQKLKKEKQISIGEMQGETKIKSTESSRTSVPIEKWRKFFDCFCIQTNARKILGDDQKQEHMDFVDGLRAIFFILVFGVHFCLLYSGSIKNIDKHMDALILHPVTRFITIASFSIDGFVLLSGFLSTYLFSKYFEKNNGKVNWIAFYAFRFIRLTPVYMVVLGFYATLLTYLSSSRIRPTYDTNPICKETWMRNLFYINNLYSMRNQCLVSTWFLACLMQLYVISPLFMIPLNRSPRIGYICIGFTVCFSCFISFSIANKHGIVSSFPVTVKGFEEFNNIVWDYTDLLHQNTFVRLTPYLIGTLLGYHLHKRKLNKKNNWLTLSMGWISSTVLLSICFYFSYKKEGSALESAIFNGVKYLLFSCGFSWLVFACATKQGAFIGKFLSHRIFKPISRLSFCAFLTHNILLEGYFLSVEVPVDESLLYESLLVQSSMIQLYIRLLLYSLLAAFVAFLLFEAPVSRLLTVYFIANRKNILTDESKIN